MLKKIFFNTLILALITGIYGFFSLLPIFKGSSAQVLFSSTPSSSNAFAPLVRAKNTFSDSGPFPEGSIEIISQGDFIGQEEKHVQGAAFLVSVSGKNYLHLDSDFSLEEKKDLKIYLLKDSAENPKTEIGEVKTESGSQNYELTQDVKLDGYTQVLIQNNDSPLARAILEKYKNELDSYLDVIIR